MKRSGKILAVIGAGGHGKVTAATAYAADLWDSIVFLDDTLKTGHVIGFPVVGTSEAVGKTVTPETHDIAVAVGNNAVREKIFRNMNQLGFDLPPVIHPTAVIAADVRIGKGCVIFARTVIQPDTHIGDGVIINTAATVDHDCTLGNFVHISPGVHLSGNTHIGSGSHIGTGSCGRQQIRVGRNVTVGAGSVLVGDISDGMTVAGNPAKPLKHTGTD